MSEQIPAAVFERFTARHTPGCVVDATVVKALPFGAIVEIDGVSGLASPAPAGLTPGAQVRVRVAAVDVAERRFAAESA
jgi:ribosomal protein S1